MSLDSLDLPLSKLEQQLVTWAEEAVELRFGGSPQLPPDGSTPGVVQNSLVDIRRRLDRLDGLYIVARRAKGRTLRAFKTGKYIADDAWDVAVTRVQRQEYQGPRERYAEASLASFEQQRESRAAERLLSVADETLDVIKMSRDGLSELRWDHVAVLRAFAFESNLER